MENFDSGTINMTSTGVPGFNVTNAYRQSLPNSMHGVFDVGTEVTLTTPDFSTSGNQFVTLQFNHICKTSFFDSCVVELSINSGLSWTQLNSATCSYLGTSQNFATTKWFGAFSYPVWDVNNATTMSNTWWKQELFDISTLCANQPTVRIRFRMKDNNGNGMENFYGWMLDDIKIFASPCELQPPSVNILSGPSGTVYQPVNTTITAYANDNSGIISSSLLYCSINNQAFLALPFNNTSDSTYFGNLPSVNIGDTVCWFIQAMDVCNNITTTPPICYYVNNTPCDLVAPDFTILSGPQNVSTPSADSVTVYITDNTNIILNPLLYFQINSGSFVTVVLNNISSNTYSAVIPAVNAGDYVCWYIEATDSCANTGVSTLNCFYALNPVTLPYANNFESGSLGWVSSSVSGSTWQLGYPAFGATTGTHSGTNAWDVELSNAYQNNSNSSLTSPIFDFTGDSNVTLSFWQNYFTEANWDGVNLEYSTDGNFWNILGFVNDPNSVNWYNLPIINSSGLPAWNNNSGGWIKSSYNLSAFDNAPFMQFRFVFTSDASVQGDGHSIDDFRISIPIAVDAGVHTLYTQHFFTAGTTSPSWQIAIYNYGSLSVGNIPVNISLNGNIINSFTYTGTIAAGDSAIVTVSGFTVPSGINSLCAYTTLTGDGDSTNDSNCITITGIPVITPLYSDNFDNGNVGWLPVTVGDSATNWELGTPGFGIPANAHSIPYCWDININALYGPSAECYLYSPYFDFSSAYSPYVSFWNNYNTESGWDGVRLEYSFNGAPWSVLGTMGDPNAINWYTSSSINSSFLPAWVGQSAGWVQSKYDLAGFPPTSILQFRFVFTSDVSIVADGFSMDDFLLFSAYSTDVGVSAVVTPGAAAGAPLYTPVVLRIKNFGYTPAGNFDVTYQANGTSPVTVTYNNSLLPGDSVDITLTGFTTIPGINTIKAYTSMSADLYHPNDTLDYSFYAVYTTTLPFTDNFEAGNIGWIVEPSVTGTLWELGMPGFGVTNSVHSGNACWDVNLNSPYNNAAVTRLVSPVFNYSNSISSNLKFWINYNMEYGQDGMRLEYTTDGVNYNPLGTYNDPNGINWYDNNNVVAFGAPAWSGNSLGWKQAIYNTTFLNGSTYVKYAFVFHSDVNLSGDGVSIDDFELNEVVGLNEQFSNAQIFLHPDPATIDLGVTINSCLQNGILSGNEITFNIMDAMGRDVMKHTAICQNNIIKTKIDIVSLPQGIYFISLKTLKGMIIQKFIKQ